ncbi:ParB/Srx family N-terminal domain-containing protein [Falsiroseomonas sp.]|uniref:ParB/Srx family N-terminal domain-containing protein n=1 Tax=Falsiroseomonas sp. TaxID=2870721 RepID=UPI0034A41292
MAAKILLRPVAELRPHAGNARVHSAEQLEQIKASMLAFGFTNPLLVDDAGVLIAGHGRLEAATALGIEKVPTIVLRHLSAAQKEALRLADNRIAENATWDRALLRDALAAVQTAQDIDLGALGFSADELADILAAAGDAVSNGDAPEALSGDPAEGGGATGAVDAEKTAEDPADADPVPPRQAVTRPGDLWLLGEHHLLCRDSTDAASVTRVMGDDRAALLFTSPTYGNQRDYTSAHGGHRRCGLTFRWRSCRWHRSPPMPPMRGCTQASRWRNWRRRSQSSASTCPCWWMMTRRAGQLDQALLCAGVA